ncbi:hypothetical protein HYPBUDRAFT_148862 [Hyphopichia burtonii NRRL Y-1933]|uniref:Uncharacterized protein n=1 Tax=Hyphopichia burtonii NRRL Y-1933 TaxID=984485 RepID=A0A1E4RIN6_9ASCO|nr:hypothetical protein HYPBUDRAFT_148862 [Hyphopichia burtonii NRRL Y-1933]ODV67096.1 hypothetical protein HYPBUDRAFT_148862 [Hyphopichia burtonii NRRL Y-1933]
MIRYVLGAVINKIPYLPSYEEVPIEEKIHQVIVDRRQEEQIRTPSPSEDELIENEPSTKAIPLQQPQGSISRYNCLHYSDTCDDFPREVGNSPINRIKDYYFQPNTPTKVRGSQWDDDDETMRYDHNPIMTKYSQIGCIPEVEEEAEGENVIGLGLRTPPGYEEPSTPPEQIHQENKDTKEIRIKQYLDEQNNKFDTLIHNNLDIVIKQQELFEEKEEEEENLTKLLIEFLRMKPLSFREKLQYSNRVFKYGIKLINPFKQAEPEMAKLAEPVTIRPNYEEDEYKDVIQVFNKLKPEIKNRIIDNYRKEEEMKRFENESLIDKFEMLSILMIKITISTIKYMIPIIQILINKFNKDEIYLFNQLNFNKLMKIIIKSLIFTENQLNNDFLKNYQYGFTKDDELDDFCKEMSNNAHHFFNNKSVDSFKSAGSTNFESSEKLSVFKIAEQFVDEF